MELTQLQELIAQIQQLQSIMIEVATGTRIQSKEDEYTKVYREVELKINSLKEEGWSISNPNAFKSLWEWYEYYRWSPELDKPHLRQAYIHNLYSNVLEQIERASYKQIVANSPAETLQELEPSRLKALISDIENLKEIMTIATDKREIEHEEEGYIEIYQKVALQIGMLHEIGLPLTNPNHFRSLWQWYSDWSSHSDSYSSEQEYVDSIYKDIIKTLRQYSSSQDETIQNLKRRFSHQEPSQAVTPTSTSPVVVMNTLDEEPAEVTSLAEDARDMNFPSSPQAPVQGSFPITMPTTQSKEGLTDFAIITAIEVERRAVCQAFELTDQHRVFKGSRVYWRNRLALKDGKFYEVVIAQSPDMTNVDAALLAAETIHQWQPSAILMVGIAGAASENQKLGDLILGSDVHYYERGKVTPNGKKPELTSYKASGILWNRVIAVPDWQSSIPVERPDGTKIRPKIHRGVIASGEKVIADAVIRDEIASAHRKTVAVDMEGYGVNAAAWQSFNQVHCLVIRAICDLADSIKNDKWHPYAAAVAASFAKHFLLDQPLEPKNSLDFNQVNVTQIQDLTGPERLKLADLLEISEQAVSTSRRTLCIRIGINPGRLDFIANTSDLNFATQLVDFLHRTGNLNALLLLCKEIKLSLHGERADMLKIIQQKIESHPSEI